MHRTIFFVMWLVLLTGPFVQPASDYKQAINTEPEPSYIVSSISFILPLVMAYAGTNGTSEEALGELLGNGVGQKIIHDYYSKTYKRLSAGMPNAKTYFANRAFVDSNFVINPSYTEFIKKYYETGLYRVHFGDQATIQKINAVVAEKTENAFPTLVDNFDKDAVFALNSAFYFHTNWKSKFSPRVPGDFHVTKDKVKRVPMMRQTGRFLYFEKDGLKCLRLPFAVDAIAIVMLPLKRHSFGSISKNIDAPTLLTIAMHTEGLEEKMVDVKLPVFKFNVTHDLRDEFMVNFTDIFTPGVANFSRIANLSRPLYVSQFLHKALIEVNEMGVKGAGATSLVLSSATANTHEVDRTYNVSIDPGSPPVQSTAEQFYADEPFTVLIADEDGFLFVGDIRMED